MEIPKQQILSMIESRTQELLGGGGSGQTP